MNVLQARLMHSPFYREKLRGHGLTPYDLVPDTLKEFPLTTRQELAECGEMFLAHTGQAELDATHRFSSTGTSGRRLTIYRGEVDELRLIRIWEEAAGLQLPETVRVLFVCTLPAPKEYSVQKQIGIRTLQIARIGAERLAQKTAATEPFQLLTGTPHGLLMAVALGVKADALGYSTALPLEPDTAARIRSGIGAPHLHCYSMTETGPIARWCPECHGAYHVFEDMLVESVSGRICITKLSDSVFPLLRYLSDDRGQVATGRMRCGFTGTSIIDLAGRKTHVPA